MSRDLPEPVPQPPANVAKYPLALRTLPAGSAVVRIHRLALAPIHFSPVPGQPPAGRFDSLTGRFGTLYAGADFDCAVVETLLRKPRRRIVGRAEVEARAVTRLVLRAPAQLVDLTGFGLSRLGLDARFLSGPYDACGAWADALHDHPSSPDGILYPSRFDPSRACLALFSRVAPGLEPAGEPVPLRTILPEVVEALARYGKLLEEG